MHLHFEQNISSRTECTLHSLTWMGKVPDSLPGDTNNGWKLNRGQYYSEGWLASGNAKGIVGVTFTTSHCRKYDPPNRSNFNLRGHRSEVKSCHCFFFPVIHFVTVCKYFHLKVFIKPVRHAQNFENANRNILKMLIEIF